MFFFGGGGGGEGLIDHGDILFLAVQLIRERERERERWVGGGERAREKEQHHMIKVADRVTETGLTVNEEVSLANSLLRYQLYYILRLSSL